MRSILLNSHYFFAIIFIIFVLPVPILCEFNFLAEEGDLRPKFVESLNSQRRALANGSMKIQYNLSDMTNGSYSFPGVTNMMEVRYSKKAERAAEIAMLAYLDTSFYQLYTFGKYYIASYSFYGESDTRNKKLFNLSEVAWPIELSSEFRRSKEYLEFGSVLRSKILMSWAEVTEIGCAAGQKNRSSENENGTKLETIMICAFGEISCSHSKPCTLFKPGYICSDCPDGFPCDDGLCSKELIVEVPYSNETTLETTAESVMITTEELLDNSASIMDSWTTYESDSTETGSTVNGLTTIMDSSTMTESSSTTIESTSVDYSNDH